MKISNSIYFTSQQLKKNNKQAKVQNEFKNINLNSNPIANLNRSSISFGAMKKSQFERIDLMMVNQLKAPIQNFNSNEDFQNYCQTILDEKYLGDENIKKLVSSKDQHAQGQKDTILKEWVRYITKENKAYTPAIQLMILSSITKNLNYNTNHLPPVLDKRKLADTIQEINKNSKTQKNYSCNFDKLYRNNLMKEIFTQESEIDENLNGWVKIDSEYNNPENFEANVKKLQTLSHDSWCTKTYNAEPYLANGDFHIYFENGKPKVGVRFEGDEIVEIQGEKNNSVVPFQYISQIEAHIAKEDLYIGRDIIYQLDEAHDKKIEFDKFVEQIGKDAIKKKDYERILPFFGITATKDENGMLVLDRYILPNKSGDTFTFEDLGLSQDDLLLQVRKINGDACFNSGVTSTGNVEIIRGNVSFDDCPIKNLGKIRKVFGGLNLTNTPITLEEALELEKIEKMLIVSKNKIAYPILLMKTTPLSRPLTLAEYSYRSQYKLNTPKEVEAFIRLIDIEGESLDEAGYLASFANAWA